MVCTRTSLALCSHHEALLHDCTEVFHTGQVGPVAAAVLGHQLRPHVCWIARRLHLVAQQFIGLQVAESELVVLACSMSEASLTEG